MSIERIERDRNERSLTAAETRSAVVSAHEPEVETPVVPLSHYLWVLKRNRWAIAGVVLASLVGTLVVTSHMTPIYESTATVDIDRQTPQGVIGQESMRSTMNDADQFLATQVRLVQSDSVLRPVAVKHDLLAHERGGRKGDETTSPSPDTPVQLKHLKVSRPPNTYLLLISYRSPDPRLAANVANGVAQSYLEHTYNIRYRSSASLSVFMEKQIEELRAKMERSSGALIQFEREMNVISPEEKTNILSSRLLQLNTEYTAAQGDRVRKEAALNSVKNGSIEAAQASTQGESLRKLLDRAGEAEEKFSQGRLHFGANHPEYRKAAETVTELNRQINKMKQTIAKRVETEYQEATAREGMLQRAVGETKQEFDRLNARSFEYQSLKREAEADKKLYEELVRKIKEAGINASFQNSAIRIADLARPGEKPVAPNLKINLLIALLASLFLAVTGAIVADLLDNTIRDPEQVARTLGTEVIGTLPVVKDWRGRLGLVSAARLLPGSAAAPNSAEHMASGYDESIRTLRNSILLTDFDQRLRSLLVTSASPGEGKSTIAAHLAASHAEQNHKTLLIDGDLRRPSVHKRFKIRSDRGLTNVLLGEMDWREAVVTPDEQPNLRILPAGPPSRRAGDLVGRGLHDLMEEALAEYDLVILDGPPLLGFAEPLQMATTVDGVVVVTRAGATNRQQVATVLATLNRLRANVLGLVLNQVHRGMSDSYTYYGYYGKYYAQRTAS